MNKDSHNVHGVLLGVATTALLSFGQVMTGGNAMLAGGALGTVSALYMRKYGHSLPGNYEVNPMAHLKPNQISNSGLKKVLYGTNYT